MRAHRLPDGPSAVYAVDPVGKPRMSQRDRWKRRPVVERYWAFRDQVRLMGIQVPPAGAHVTFVIPMPRSWSKRRRAEMAWQPHQQTPDADNLLKGLLDAVYDNDAGVWDARVTKVWGEQGMVIVSDGDPQLVRSGIQKCFISRQMMASMAMRPA